MSLLTIDKKLNNNSNLKEKIINYAENIAYDQTYSKRNSVSKLLRILPKRDF